MKTPVLLLTTPSFVKFANCAIVPSLVKTPVALFVKREFEVMIPALFSVPELFKPPELVIRAVALAVIVPVLVNNPPLKSVSLIVNVELLVSVPKLSILKAVLRGALITTEAPPGIVALLPTAGSPFDQLATVNQSPFAGPVNCV